MAPSAELTTANEQWSAVIQTCFIRRYQPETVSDALVELFTHEKISGTTIVDIILRCGAQPRDGTDPLVAAYLNHFLQLRLLDTADVLDSLLESSRYALNTKAKNGLVAFPMVAEYVLNLLSNLFGTGERPKVYTETDRTFRSLESWMEACNSFETTLQITDHGMQTPDAGLVATFEALGVFAAVMLSNPVVKKHLTKILSPST